MGHRLGFSLLLLCLLQTFDFTGAQPTMVVEVFRHGARGPSVLQYDSSWQVHGELTPVGMRQHYILGSIMAQRYPHLLDEYDPRYIYIKSTNYNRTIMSVSAQAYAAFEGKGPSIQADTQVELTLPPFEDKDLVESISSELTNVQASVPNGFQPLVIQVVEKPQDRVLFVGPWNCDSVAKWQQEKSNDARNQEILEYLKGTMTELRSLGYNVQTGLDLHNFGDTLIDNHFDGRPLPRGVEYGSTVYNDSVFAFQWYSIYNFVGEGTERLLKSLYLLDQIVAWFEGAAKGTNPLKFAFMSAHDTSLLPLLGLYNITNSTCFFENYKSEKLGKELPYPDCVYPMFASQVLYEFYNSAEGPYIKFLYNGKPFKICNTDTYECSLKDFAAKTRSLLMNHYPKDYDGLCTVQIPDTTPNKPTDDGGSPFWYIVVIIGLLFVVGGLVYLLHEQRKQIQLNSDLNKFHQINDDTDKEMKEVSLLKNLNRV